MDLQAGLVMKLNVIIDSPKVVGKTLEGMLAIIPIVGGTFEGPEIRGKVCPGGADWNTRIDDFHSHVLAKYWIETSDGEFISIENEGFIDNSVKDSVIITTPKFYVDTKGKYASLALGVYVGELTAGAENTSVDITIYRMK